MAMVISSDYCNCLSTPCPKQCYYFVSL